MIDCLKTLHGIINSNAECARIMSDLVRVWPVAVAAQKEAPTEAVAHAVGSKMDARHATRRLCPMARRVIEKTAINWSGK